MRNRRDTILHRLRRLGPQRLKAEIAPALQAAGEKVKANAARSITEGAVSGRNHVPSAPNSPPNEDTGHLRTNIKVTQPEPLKVQVSSEAGYSAALEFGTSKMAARPFMRPAAQATQDDAQKLVAKAVKRAIRNMGN